MRSWMGLAASVDAMARLGYLYLRRGRWRGKQIIPEWFIDAARTTPRPLAGLPVVDEKRYGKCSAHYGLLWWNNADGTLADVLLFGSFLAWAVVDRISLKRRTPGWVPSAPPSRCRYRLHLR